MATLTLTAAATAAAQELHVLDSGEALSTQQIADALARANDLLASWHQEQSLAMGELVIQQARDGVVFVAQQAALAAPLATAFTLAGGTYGVSVYTAPTYIPGAVPQFADATTPITVPAGYPRAIALSLAIEMASMFQMEPSGALLKQAAEARAAASPMPGRIPIPGMSAASGVAQ